VGVGVVGVGLLGDATSPLTLRRRLLLLLLLLLHRQALDLGRRSQQDDGGSVSSSAPTGPSRLLHCLLTADTRGLSIHCDGHVSVSSWWSARSTLPSCLCLWRPPILLPRLNKGEPAKTQPPSSSWTLRGVGDDTWHSEPDWPSAPL
jgi:hypothetical protein